MVYYRDPTVNNDRRVLLLGKEFGLDGNIMKNINDQLKRTEWSLLQSSYRRFIAMLKRLRELTPSVMRYRGMSDACCIFPECDEYGVLTGPHRRLRHKRNLEVSKYWGIYRQRLRHNLHTHTRAYRRPGRASAGPGPLQLAVRLR